MQRTVLFIFTFSIGTCLGFSELAKDIPNGNNVVNTCIGDNSIWLGVGHNLIYGTGDRNAFGLDFKKNGLVWTKELCMADSDGDGKTNGEELGDKLCQWKKGQKPLSPPLSHPGICEPVTSTECLKKNKNIQGCPKSAYW